MADAATNRSIDKFSKALSAFQLGTTHEVPAPLVQTFLAVARNEGKTVNELVELTNGNRSTVSRHLLDLSENLRNGAPGYGLLNRVRNPTDLRSVMFVLSPKGKNYLTQMRDIMEA